MEHGKREQLGRYWNYFTKKEGYLATCNLCFNDYSYRSNSGNLGRHLLHKHGLEFENVTVVDNDSDGDTDMKPNIKEARSTMSFFKAFHSEKSQVKCKLCEKHFSFDAVEELRKHVIEEHEEQHVDENCDEKDPAPVPNTGRYWKFFTKKERFVATCKICRQDYSYRSTNTNLAKHLRKKHGIDFNSVPAPNSDSEPETVNKPPVSKKRKVPTWSYFDVLDSDKFEAQCKICEKNIPYETVEELKKHIEDHGENPVDSEDEDAATSKTPKKKSMIWKYFKQLEGKLAICMICKKVFSAGTISNLKKHLNRIHPNAEIPNADDFNDTKYIVSANGQLYEVESETEIIQAVDDDDDDRDPIEMDAVYLEDIDSVDFTHHSSPSPKKKKAKLIMPKRQSFSVSQKEQIFNNSSNTDIPRRDSYNTSLDYFGQYVVSLLKELPKSVSSQLQNEILKQILTSKVALESEASNCKVSINNINQNTDIQTNNNVTEQPVIYVTKPDT